MDHVPPQRREPSLRWRSVNTVKFLRQSKIVFNLVAANGSLLKPIETLREEKQLLENRNPPHSLK